MRSSIPQTTNALTVVFGCTLAALLMTYHLKSGGSHFIHMSSSGRLAAAPEAGMLKTAWQAGVALELGQMHSSNATCTGQGDVITCEATWACLETKKPTTLFGGVLAAPVDVLLRPRWSAKPVLTLQPHAQLQARGYLANTSAHVIKGTTLLSQRYAVGNFGHMLLENLTPLIRAGQRMDANFSLTSASILLLDDCNNTADFDLMWGYPRTPVNCFDKYAELVQQLEPSASMAVLSDVVPQGVDLVCFEKAFFGVGGLTGLVVASSPEHAKAIQLFRSHWERQLNKLRQPRKGLQVVIHAKHPSNRHGGAILNAPELCKALQANIATVNCTVFSLDDLKTVSQQLQLFANADVFVSDTGSAQYYALFMPAGGLHITAELCKAPSAEQACNDIIAGNMQCEAVWRATMGSFTNVKSIVLPPLAPSALSWYKGIYKSAWEAYNSSCAPNTPKGAIFHFYDMNLPADAVVQLVSQHLATQAA